MPESLSHPSWRHHRRRPRTPSTDRVSAPKRKPEGRPDRFVHHDHHLLRKGGTRSPRGRPRFDGIARVVMRRTVMPARSGTSVSRRRGPGTVDAKERPLLGRRALARTTYRKQGQDHAEHELCRILRHHIRPQVSLRPRALDERAEKVARQLGQRRRRASDRCRWPATSGANRSARCWFLRTEATV